MDFALEFLFLSLGVAVLVYAISHAVAIVHNITVDIRNW